MRVEWSRDRRRHVTLKGQGHDLDIFGTQYLENSSRQRAGSNGAPIANCILRIEWSRD